MSTVKGGHWHLHFALPTALVVAEPRLLGRLLNWNKLSYTDGAERARKTSSLELPITYARHFQLSKTGRQQVSNLIITHTLIVYSKGCAVSDLA